MIARGAVFAALRSTMLQNVGSDVHAGLESERTIGKWLQVGAFVVPNCTKRLVTLHASRDDYAVTLLSEVENLLNHCLEHIQEMLCTAGDTRDRSQGWAIVTVYYLGFFAASAMLRLIGRPIVVLTREQLDTL